MIWGFAIWREFEIWVASQYTNNFIRIIMIAFGGVAMIDGPDVVERVMGIDVGVKDGMMKTMEDRDQKTMQGESRREAHRLRSSKCPILASRLKTDRM